MLRTPSTPVRQKPNVVWLEKNKGDYGITNYSIADTAIVIKSPTKYSGNSNNDSPAKKRTTLIHNTSAIKVLSLQQQYQQHQQPAFPASTFPMLHESCQNNNSSSSTNNTTKGDESINQQQSQSRLQLQIPVPVQPEKSILLSIIGTTRNRVFTNKFYYIAWLLGIITLVCLSIRSSIVTLPITSMNHPMDVDNNLRLLSTISDTATTTMIVVNDNIDTTTNTNIQHDIENVIQEAEQSPEYDTIQQATSTTTTTTATEVVGVVKENPYTSPYTTYRPDRIPTPKFAYAYVISGCNEDAPHRNYLYDIAISTYVQREAGSIADVIVYIQMAYKSSLIVLEEKDQMLFNAMNIQIRYIPKAEDESFYRTMMDKFLILNLIQYERVLFMDGDVMARGNMDYLFDLSVRGILKRNIVTAGKTEPANGGFFMLAPSNNASERIMNVIRNKEERGKQLPYPHWDETIGWGHIFDGDSDYPKLKHGFQHKIWNFYGAFADQGLLYQWVKYEEKSVSIIFHKWIENWDVDNNGTLHMEKRIGLNIFDEYNHDRVCWNIRPCKTPFKDFIHFTGRSKPWLVSPPFGFQNDTTSSPSHFWYNTLYVLNEKMNLGIDFQQWRQFHRPYLGMFPTHHTASKTSYAGGTTSTNTSTSEMSAASSETR